jgi:hypothetical protein
MKKYINKLISVRFTDRKEAIFGYVIAYNDDWTLMKCNPVDYVIDGYIIFRHKNIEGFRREVEEKFREKVLNLKGLKPNKDDIFPITDLKTILEFLSAKFGVFQLYTKSEKACYLGHLRTIDTKQLIIDNLNSKGKWDGYISFRPGDVRIIEFNTDYINSLKLVAARNKSSKPGIFS